MNDLTVKVPDEVGGECTAEATETGTPGEWTVALDGREIGLVWMTGRSDYHYSTPYSASAQDETEYTLGAAVRGVVQRWRDDQRYANS
jgi:hypothetical protein